MPRLLSLFDGTGAISRLFIEENWEVQSLDVDGSHGATVVTDILNWDYSQEPPCDVLIAGVPCEQYSIANTRGVRNFALADSLVRKTWEIVQHFQGLNPLLAWFIENPDSSKLWTRQVSEPFPHRVRLDFCQYGTPYRKRTKLATNTDFMPRPLCDPSTCPSCVDGKHIRSAQQGPSKHLADPQDCCTLDELHAYPRALCWDIYQHCSGIQ